VATVDTAKLQASVADGTGAKLGYRAVGYQGINLLSKDALTLEASVAEDDGGFLKLQTGKSYYVDFKDAGIADANGTAMSWTNDVFHAGAPHHAMWGGMVATKSVSRQDVWKFKVGAADTKKPEILYHDYRVVPSADNSKAAVYIILHFSEKVAMKDLGLARVSVTGCRGFECDHATLEAAETDVHWTHEPHTANYIAGGRNHTECSSWLDLNAAPADVESDANACNFYVPSGVDFADEAFAKTWSYYGSVVFRGVLHAPRFAGAAAFSGTNHFKARFPTDFVQDLAGGSSDHEGNNVGPSRSYDINFKLGTAAADNAPVQLSCETLGPFGVHFDSRRITCNGHFLFFEEVFRGRRKGLDVSNNFST
jgi:hypothetical protein